MDFWKRIREKSAVDQGWGKEKKGTQKKHLPAENRFIFVRAPLRKYVELSQDADIKKYK